MGSEILLTFSRTAINVAVSQSLCGMLPAFYFYGILRWQFEYVCSGPHNELRSSRWTRQRFISSQVKSSLNHQLCEVESLVRLGKNSKRNEGVCIGAAHDIRDTLRLRIQPLMSLLKVLHTSSGSECDACTLWMCRLVCSFRLINSTACSPTQ